MNIPQILEEAAVVIVDVEVDATELASGADVQIPFEPQVATLQTKPVYFAAELTTTKPSDDRPVVQTKNAAADLNLGNVNVGEILTDIAEVAVEYEADEGLLEAGQTVQLPFVPQIGTTANKPIYLVGSLSETKQTSLPATKGGA